MTTHAATPQLEASLRELAKRSHIDLKEEVLSELVTLIASGKSATQVNTFLLNLGGHSSRNPLTQRQ